MQSHPRSDIFGAQLPTNTAGTPRALLRRPLRQVTVHYVGSGSFVDPGDSQDEIRAIERWASSPAKRTPWEYGEVVDSSGDQWVYAGEYLAAHAGIHNATSYGVLLLLGVNDPVTDAMVEGFHDLIRRRVADGTLTADVTITPHRGMTGATTTCPGPAAIARWAELVDWRAPVVPLPPPTEPPLVTTEDPVQIIQPLMDGWVLDPAVFVRTGQIVEWITDGADVGRLVAQGADVAVNGGPIVKSYRDFEAFTLLGPLPNAGQMTADKFRRHQP